LGECLFVIHAIQSPKAKKPRFDAIGITAFAHPCITLADYQTASSLSPACQPMAESPANEKRRRQLKEKPSTAFINPG